MACLSQCFLPFNEVILKTWVITPVSHFPALLPSIELRLLLTKWAEKYMAVTINKQKKLSRAWCSYNRYSVNCWPCHRARRTFRSSQVWSTHPLPGLGTFIHSEDTQCVPIYWPKRDTFYTSEDSPDFAGPTRRQMKGVPHHTSPFFSRTAVPRPWHHYTLPRSAPNPHSRCIFRRTELIYLPSTLMLAGLMASCPQPWAPAKSKPHNHLTRFHPVCYLHMF